MKRYNAVFPQELFNQVVVAADREGISVAELLRKFIKQGIEVEKALDRGAVLVKKEGDKKTELIII